MGAEFARRALLVPRLAEALAALAVLGAFHPAAAASAGAGGLHPSPVRYETPEALLAPPITAAAGILIDAADGRVLWERASGEKRAIASTTKIITGLVVVERLRPEEHVTISARAEAIGASDSLVTELEVVAGETLTVEQLLYGLLLTSASDAAAALAEHVAGTQEAFAVLMNDRARRAGATRSNFVNPHGFDHPDHYSTAADLALVSREAMRNPLFKQIAGTAEYDLVRPGHATQRLVNRNELLGAFEGANGVKTGRTKAAGKSLVASAQRKDELRIAVVLASPDPAKEAAALLHYGFSGFRRFFAARAGRAWGTLTYGDGTTARLVAPADSSVLIVTTGPDPASRYEEATGRLLVDLPGTPSVPLVRECSSESTSGGSQLPARPSRTDRPLLPPRPCRPETGGPSLVARFLSLLRPVLSYARG